MSGKDIVRPIIEYPDSRTHLWKNISKNLPDDFNNYYEPFVGSGSTWLNVQAKNYYINDLSKDLMRLYGLLKVDDSDLLYFADQIHQAWEMKYLDEIVGSYSDLSLFKQEQIESLIYEILPRLNQDLSTIIYEVSIIEMTLRKCLIQKLKSVKEKDDYDMKDRLKNVVKETIYILLRDIYNHEADFHIRTVIYWFLREFSFESNFDFNDIGDFIVPYGGIKYDNNKFSSKLDIAKSSPFQSKLKKTEVMNLDVYNFFRNFKPQHDDFVFLDPPFEQVYSYYEKKNFDEQDHLKFSTFVKQKLITQFMLIIESTTFTKSLYSNGEEAVGGRNKLIVKSFTKKNKVTNRETEYLLVKNY